MRYKNNYYLLFKEKGSFTIIIALVGNLYRHYQNNLLMIKGRLLEVSEN
ncbi:MAG: hypothetical protein JWN78_3037 [Bacteroidota bacterium]|nr:hypothetical protein [Bacteroidota bacterium]